MLQWLHTNPSKHGLVLNVRNQGNLKRTCMGSSERNRCIMSSLIAGKMLNFGMEAFFILIFLNIITNLVIPQIKFLWRHYFGTLLWIFFDNEDSFVFFDKSLIFPKTTQRVRFVLLRRHLVNGCCERRDREVC